jgi:putative PIN family toxin of toxin-antitoxin system
MKDRAVFDCMIYFQAAARKEGPSAACLQLVRDGQLELYISSPIVSEVKDVLARPKLRQKFSDLTPENVAVFLQDVENKTILLAEVPPVFHLERDPKDDKYVNLAVAAGANYLVSRDKDLLDLMKDPDFRARYPDLTILDAAAFLHVLSKERPSEQALQPSQEHTPEVPQDQGTE